MRIVVFSLYNCCLILFVQDQATSNRKEMDKFCYKMITIDKFIRSIITRKNLVTESHRFPGISQEESRLLLLLQFLHLRKTQGEGERRGVVPVFNLRVMEGWDHSAERTPKRRKPIT